MYLNHKKYFICAIAKNEDNYIEEWIQYHLLLGFDTIFLYTNDWSFSLKNTYNNIVVQPFNGVGVQTECYNKFLDEHQGENAYVAFIDIDEFIWLGDNYQSIHSFFDNYQHVNKLYVNWRIFGDSHLSKVYNGNYSVLNRFVKCAKNLSPFGKNIVNLQTLRKYERFTNSGPHIMMVLGKIPVFYVAGDMQTKSMKNKQIWNFYKLDNMQIELWHFKNKTFEESIKRRYNTTDVSKNMSSIQTHTDYNTFLQAFQQYNCNEITNEKMKNLYFSLKCNNQ